MHRATDWSQFGPARGHRVSPGRRASAAARGESRSERASGYRAPDRGDPAAGGHPIALIVDSGPLYAYADEDDRDHEASLALLQSHPGPLIVPQLVVTEVAYVLETRLGPEAEVRFLGDLASGNLIAEPVRPSDWIRIAELVAEYADLPLGTVDASVVTTAERLRVLELATLDRRHFAVVRPAHAEAFTLLP